MRRQNAIRKSNEGQDRDIYFDKKDVITSFETKTPCLSNYRRGTDVTDIIRTSSSYIILKWHTDDKETSSKNMETKSDRRVQQGTGERRHLF